MAFIIGHLSAVKHKSGKNGGKIRFTHTSPFTVSTQPIICVQSVGGSIVIEVAELCFQLKIIDLSGSHNIDFKNRFFNAQHFWLVVCHI